MMLGRGCVSLRHGPASSNPTQSSHQHFCVTCGATRRCTGASQNSISRQRQKLPNGQGVLLDEASASQDVVYGQVSRQLPNGQGCIVDAGAWLITRPRRRSNYSLVRRPGAQVQRCQGKPEQQNLGLALVAMQSQRGMVPFLSGRIADGSLVIDTWAEDVPDSANDAAADACLGIVPYEGPEVKQNEAATQQDAEWIVETSSSNPRRTQKVKFTCKLCGCTTISPVNPHAFHNGVVFARCGNVECAIIHKVKDNLKLFHEVRGPVFRAQPRVRLALGLQAAPRMLPGFRMGGVDILNARSSGNDGSIF